MAANFLNKLFRLQRPDRSLTEGPRTPTAVSRTLNQRRSMTYRDAIAANEALKHPVIYRCVNKIATSVSFVDWYAEIDPDYKGTKPTAKQLQQVNDLLQNPNDGMTANQFRYWMALVLALNARVPYLVTQNSTKVPVGLYPLDAAQVTRELDDRGIAKAYKYGSGAESKTYKAGFIVREKNLNEPYAEELYLPNLTGFNYSGVDASALGAMGLPADVITYLLKRCVDTASGRPNIGYVITTEKGLTKDQEKALREKVEETKTGGEDAGDILILHNTKIEVNEIKNDLSDIHTKVPVDDMTRMIAGIFGIPVALLGLGAADGSKFAGNYVESRLTFWEDTVVPGYLVPMQVGMTRAICPPGIRVKHDLDSIPALQAGRASLAKELSGVQFLTKNEKRELLGFEKRDDGNEYDVVNPRAPTSTSSGGQNENDA